MQIFSTPESLKVFISKQRSQHKKIGLVPTMGALHQGHLELIRNSVSDNDITICSIYVNPTQFNDQQDLLGYPRDFDQDIKKLEQNGCHVVFCPSDEEMYPQESGLTLDFGALENVMEGLHRPGHFNGVAQVVSKLFHMTQPDKAYFGAKDWQQLVIIKQLVNDLSFPLEIVGIPIVREKDGLAMSSRNQRLTPDHRIVAAELYKALSLVKEQLQQSVGFEQAIAAGIDHCQQFPKIDLEYLEIVRSSTLNTPLVTVGSEPLSICIAASIGGIRLIDNVQIFQKPN